MMDWKEALAGLQLPEDAGRTGETREGDRGTGETGGTREVDRRTGETGGETSGPKSKGYGKLKFFKERKGRKGKTAIIIEGFECDDDELKRIAGELKRKLGVGGSARDGSILIQGDLLEEAKRFFSE